MDHRHQNKRDTVANSPLQTYGKKSVFTAERNRRRRGRRRKALLALVALVVIVAVVLALLHYRFGVL